LVSILYQAHLVLKCHKIVDECATVDRKITVRLQHLRSNQMPGHSVKGDLDCI